MVRPSNEDGRRSLTKKELTTTSQKRDAAKRDGPRKRLARRWWSQARLFENLELWLLGIGYITLSL